VGKGCKRGKYNMLKLYSYALCIYFRKAWNRNNTHSLLKNLSEVKLNTKKQKIHYMEYHTTINTNKIIAER